MLTGDLSGYGSMDLFILKVEKLTGGFFLMSTQKYSIKY